MVRAGDWRAALALLNERHPTADGYLDRYRQTWAAMQRAAVEHDLVTWPDFPIRYQPIPAWARGCAPYLYLLIARRARSICRAYRFSPNRAPPLTRHRRSNSRGCGRRTTR